LKKTGHRIQLEITSYKHDLLTAEHKLTHHYSTTYLAYAKIHVLAKYTFLQFMQNRPLCEIHYAS